MRLIDATELNNGLREQQKSYEHTSGIQRPINEAVKDGIIIARTHIDYAPTVNAIPIPEGATNGEVLMAMINPYKICEYKYSVHVYMTEKNFLNGNYQMNLDSDWWNAPYKRESEK